MTSIDMTTMSRSFAAAAAATAAAPAPAVAPVCHAIPTGSWTLYFHEPEDKSWTLESYKRIAVTAAWEGLGMLLRELGNHRITNGMLFAMRGDTSPLWENKANIRGGSYCLKISRRHAADVYQRYLAAAALGVATTTEENAIVGVTMSPKKGFCIIKLWNASSTAFNSPTDVVILHEEVRPEEILYRPHTDQKM